MTRDPLKVVILGAGQQGRIMRHILELIGEHPVLGYLDDGAKGAEILGNFARWESFQRDGIAFAIAIGANAARAKVFRELDERGARFVNAIHPRSCIEPGVKLGRNVTVGALAYINIGAQIGDNVIINNGCIIEHDNVIGAHCHLAPGAITAGEVTIGEGVFIGMGATIRDRLSIPPRCVIGAHANVVDTPAAADAVYYGNPARRIRQD